MERNLDELTRREYDLIVVGGGIFGACAAWDAVLRGMSVALIERHDFSGAASANSFKMAHGGIRYLQHADIARVRQSCRERSALLRVAPHLVEPLPIAIPTYGHGLKGKALLGAGMLAYDLLTLDRNAGIPDPARHIPRGRLLDRGVTLDLFPNLESPDLTGAAVFCDGQIYNGPRLALSFLRSAVDRGVRAANYVEATGLCLGENRVAGVKARDLISGEELEIRGAAVLNATGGWASQFLGRSLPETSLSQVPFSRDACFIVSRRLSSHMGVALSGATKDPDAVISRSARHLFVVPWRDVSLIGVWHVVWRDHPDAVTVIDQELESFLGEINGACPGLDLELADVRAWNAGLVPFGDNQEGAQNLRYGHRSHIVDHGREQGVAGLVSLIGVRYTTARGDAARAVDLVVSGQGRRAPRPATHRLPVFGGDFDRLDDLETRASRTSPVPLESHVLRALLRNYGTGFEGVLDLARKEPSLGDTLRGSTVLKAEVVHAVRDEMALMLEDVAFRRTDLASGGDPGEAALSDCAELMARERGWSAAETKRQLDAVRGKLFRPAGGRTAQPDGPAAAEARTGHVELAP